MLVYSKLIIIFALLNQMSNIENPKKYPISVSFPKGLDAVSIGQPFNNAKSGLLLMRTTHHSKHPLYIPWTNMKQRCFNKNRPDYKYYGGTGITVCSEWINNFLVFKEWSIKNGWHKDLTLDRKDGSKNYSPNNCRWVTREIQSRNQKKKESNTSGYIGVSEAKKTGNWQSYISVNGSLKQLGYHYTAKEAALIRDNYILKNKLEGFKLNF